MMENWEIRKLGDLTTALNGLWVGKKPPFVNIAVIRNTNFTKDCQLDTTDIAYIDAEVKHFSTRKLQCGDIIIEKSGGSDKQPVGRPVLFNIPEGDFSFSNFTSTLRINDQSEIRPSFLHKALWAIYRSGKTASLQSKTTGIRNLDFKSYLKLPIPVPPIAEQEKIDAELDCLTGIIEKKKRQLDELDKLARSIYYDMFGDPISNEKGWEVRKLGECFPYMKNGANIKQERGAEGIPITRIETLSGGVFNRDRLGYANILSVGKYDKNVLNDCDILMSHINSKAYIGRAVVYHKAQGETIIHGMNLLRLIADRTLISPVFAEQFFKTDFFKEQIASIRKDAVNQSSVATGDLKALKVVLPPLDLQNEFAEKIEAIEKQKELVKRSIVETKILFNNRMNYWFN